MRSLFFAAVVICGLLQPPPRAWAHEVIGSVSNSIITAHEAEINYYVTIPPELFAILEATIGVDNAALIDYFAKSVDFLTGNEKVCRLAELEGPAPQASGNTIFHARYECAQTVDSLTVKSQLFYDLDAKHLQLTRIADPADPGHFYHEAVLRLNSPVLSVESIKSGGDATWNRIYGFFALGIEHILSGYDHILFLVSAILLSASLMTTARIITSFTIAHSITLVSAFIGLVSLPSGIVEPLIALTVAYVAFENLFVSNLRRRWIVTFFFGLIHGFGFVGALKQITVSKAELITSLVSFNIGIEAGQLLIIAAIYPLFRYVGRRAWGLRFQRVTSLLIGVAGSLWFITRVFL